MTSTRTDVITDRARRASLARRPVTAAELDTILSPAYLDWVLGRSPNRPGAA